MSASVKEDLVGPGTSDVGNPNDEDVGSSSSNRDTDFVYGDDDDDDGLVELSWMEKELCNTRDEELFEGEDDGGSSAVTIITEEGDEHQKGAGSGRSSVGSSQETVLIENRKRRKKGIDNKFPTSSVKKVSQRQQQQRSQRIYRKPVCRFVNFLGSRCYDNRHQPTSEMSFTAPSNDEASAVPLQDQEQGRQQLPYPTNLSTQLQPASSLPHSRRKATSKSKPKLTIAFRETREERQSRIAFIGIPKDIPTTLFNLDKLSTQTSA